MIHIYSNPTMDGWYTVWYWDPLEPENKYISRAFYFVEANQWSKCGVPDTCVMKHPEGWLEYGDL